MIGVGVARSVRWTALRPRAPESSSTANSRPRGVTATDTVERHHTRWFGLADRLLVLAGTPDATLTSASDFGGWRY